MRGLLIFAVVVILFLAVTTTMVVKARRSQFPAPLLEPERQYMPGSVRPVDSYCDWQFSISRTRSCIALPKAGNYAGKRITFALDGTQQIITRTTIRSYNLTVGEVMLAWGEPTGYIRTGIMAQVYWGTRSAYIVSANLTPYSPIIFINYSLQTQEQLPWKGLVNGR